MQGSSHSNQARQCGVLGTLSAFQRDFSVADTLQVALKGPHLKQAQLKEASHGVCAVCKAQQRCRRVAAQQARLWLLQEGAQGLQRSLLVC